ncbi:MAG: hypothetical protein ACTS2F_29560, partial [Thainema sp.]
MVTAHQPKAQSIRLVPEETQKLANWVDEVKQKDITVFEQARTISRRLGLVPTYFVSDFLSNGLLPF